MAFIATWASTLAGCAYARPPGAPPSQELVRIVARAPEQYSLRVNTGNISDHDVPQDGRMKIGVPGYGRACDVYLFNILKVGGSDPLQTWSLTLIRKGKIIRKLSLRAVRSLATDEAGYHLLKVED